MSDYRRPLAAALSFALGLAALAPAGALLADPSAKQIMKARHDHYHELGDAFKTIRDQTRASKPDLAAIRSAAQAVNEASVDQARWFPAGTGPEAGKTRAKAQIWTRPKEFEVAQKAFSDAAPKLLAAANAGDLAAAKTRFEEVGQACKNCHDTFRAPEDH